MMLWVSKNGSEPVLDDILNLPYGVVLLRLRSLRDVFKDRDGTIEAEAGTVTFLLQHLFDGLGVGAVLFE